jgi:hypothetical protein
VEEVRDLHGLRELPWLCAGDFNEILHLHKKDGGLPRSKACMDRFKEALEKCELSDLGYSGDVFTWRNNHHQSENYIRERLDRVVANAGWRSRFISVHVRNGDPYHSDHRLVVILTESQQQRRNARSSDRPFKFEASWLEEEKCRKVVLQAWENGEQGPEVTVAEALKGVFFLEKVLKGVANSLNDWNCNVLGDLQKRLKKLEKELEKCRRRHISQENVGLEAVLRYRVDRIEEQIDIYWKQRAHTNWLLKGDRNMIFFHHACSERRKKNRIGRLKKECSGWVEDEAENRFLLLTTLKTFSDQMGLGIHDNYSRMLCLSNSSNERKFTQRVHYGGGETGTGFNWRLKGTGN